MHRKLPGELQGTAMGEPAGENHMRFQAGWAALAKGENYTLLLSDHEGLLERESQKVTCKSSPNGSVEFTEIPSSQGLSRNPMA